MSDRILDISDRPARLTARGGLLVIDFGKPWETSRRTQTAPLAATSPSPQNIAGEHTGATENCRAVARGWRGAYRK
jgi:hypothetical protein